jgi:hypothetical protein
MLPRYLKSGRSWRFTTSHRGKLYDIHPEPKDDHISQMYIIAEINDPGLAIACRLELGGSLMPISACIDC